MTAASVPAGEAPLGALVAPEPDERPDLWPSTARRGDDGALVINAPGSRGGVKDTVAVVGPLVPHVLEQLGGGDH